MRRLAALITLTTACARPPHERAENPPPASAPSAVAAAAPPATVTPATTTATPAATTATPALIAALADPRQAGAAIDPTAGVLEVNGATEDPSDDGPSGLTPRRFHSWCRADAEREVAAFAKAMIAHARMAREPIDCDNTFLDVDDPKFGAVTAEPGVKGRPGIPSRYALCMSHGVAEYDTAYAIYFRRDFQRGLVVFGLVTTETGSIFVEEDHGILASEATAQILRCP